MNEQLPPVDPRLGEHLARRSAGRVPPGLLTDVISELDRTPVRLDRPRIAFALGHRNRQTAGALAGLAAVVALVAALIAMPALQTGPSALKGYPTDRALTTAELAAVMAGPALAANTALVAEVTIQTRTDVCPMNRYPTIGVVEGMRAQVCVMGSGVGAYMNVAQQSGVFAFRYLAPGVLGLVGQVTPASSRLAFHVADDWPLTGKTFVVEAWLGGTPFVQWACPAGGISAGDVLSPNGGECGLESWLADSATPGAIGTPAGKAFANASVDPIALFGDARLVKAGGMRQIDSVDSAPPQHGEYLVRSSTGACPADPPTSSRGCPYWLVLAKLADITVPTPTSTPTLQVPSGYPIDRALTTSELGRLLDAGSLKPYDTVVAHVQVTAEASGACQAPGNGGLEFAGLVDGIDPQVCVYLGSATAITPGDLVLRVLRARTLGYMGTVSPGSAHLAYDAANSWPGDGSTFLVAGWLSGLPHSCPGVPSPTAQNILDAGRDRCSWHRLTSTSTPVAWPSNDPSLASGLVAAEDALAMQSIDDFAAPVHGVYVVRSCSPASSSPCSQPLVLARLTDVALAAPTATPSLETPSGYPTDRALTTPELARLLDGGSLKLHDTVVVDAQVDLSAPSACPILDSVYPINLAGVIAGLSPTTCLYSSSASGITPGHLVLRVLGARSLGYMGTIAAPSSGGPLAYDATGPWPPDYGFFLVHGWLDTAAWACGRPESLPGYGGPDPLLPVYNTMCHAALTKTKFLPPDSATSFTPIPAGPPRILSFGIPPDGTSVDAGPYFTVPATSPDTGSREGTYLLMTQRHYSRMGTSDPEDYYLLARLTDIVLPTPSPTPTDSPSRQPPATPVLPIQPTLPSGYPAGRPLTSSELERALAAGLSKDQVVVAQVSFTQGNGCSPVGSYKPIGLITGMSSDVCLVGIGDGRPEHSPASTSGVFAFRVLDASTLGFMANVDAFLGADDSWPAGKTVLVSGWLEAGQGPFSCGMIGALSNEPLDPGGVPCGQYWISASPVSNPAATAEPSSPKHVFLPDYPNLGGGLLPMNASASNATYLVRDEDRCNSTPTATDTAVNTTWNKLCGWQIMARVDPVTLPAESTASPTPTTTPLPSGTATLGLAGPSGRPLTMAELLSAYKADQLHLAGRIVITKGPVPADLACATSFNFPETCQYLSETTTGDYWAVKVGADGKLSVVGELATPNSSFVSTIVQANAAKVSADRVVVVDAWLDWANDCDTPTSTPPCFFSVLTNESVSWMHMRSLYPWDSVPAWEVQNDAYTTFGGDPSLQHPTQGLYLVQVGGYGSATILARLATTGSANP